MVCPIPQGDHNNAISTIVTVKQLYTSTVATNGVIMTTMNSLNFHHKDAAVPRK